MTEFEFLSATDSALAFSAEAAMGFFTVFGAYVLTAFLAGRSFSKVAAILVSLLYSFFLLGPIAGILMSIDNLEHLLTLYFQQYPDGVIVRRRVSYETLLFLILSPLLVGWLASIFYMHGYARKQNTEDRK